VKPKSNKEEKLRDKHIKWNGEMEGNGMRKLMMVGEKCHATWRVMCFKMSVLVAT